MNKNEVKLIISADNTGAVKGIQGTSQSLGDFSSKTGSLLSNIQSHWLGFAGTLYGAKKAVDFFIFGAANAADEIKRMSYQTSVGTDQLQAFKQIALTSGTSMDSLSMGLFSFSQRLADAYKGIGDTNNVFKALDIDLRDTKGRLKDTGDLFIETARKFSNMANSFDKTDLAEKLFGRGTRNILPMFDELAENIDRVQQKGPVFSEDQIKSAKEFNDNLTLLRENIKNLTYSVGNAVIPTLNELLSPAAEKESPKWIQEEIRWTKELIKMREQFGGETRELYAELDRLESGRMDKIRKFHVTQAKTVQDLSFVFGGEEFTPKTAAPIAFDEKQWLKDQAEYEKTVGEAFRKDGELSAKAAKDAEEAAKRKQEVYADMYESLKFDTERYYTYQHGLLESRRDEEIAVTGDIALAWEAFYARSQELEEARIMRTNDFLGGISVFYAELERDGFTWAEGAKGMMEDFASGGQNAMSRFLKGVQTDTKNIGDHLENFVRDFTESFIDAVNRMISEWLMFQLLTGIGSGLAGGFGGAKSMGVGGTAGTTQAGGFGSVPFVGSLSPQGGGGQTVVQQSININVQSLDGQDAERVFNRNSHVIQKIVGDGVDKSRTYAAQLRGNRGGQ